MIIFAILEPFGLPKMDPKRKTKARKWTGCMVQMAKLRNKPLKKTLDPSYQDKWSKNNQKTVFLYCFWPFSGQMDPKRYPKTEK
jgi:hypothetical protein